MALTKATAKARGVAPNNLMVKYFLSDKHTAAAKRPANHSPRNLTGSTRRGSGSSTMTPMEMQNDVVSGGEDEVDTKEKGKAILEPEVEPVTPEVEAAIQKRKRRSYEAKRTYQPHWAALHPWTEVATTDDDGVVTQVRCSTCSKVEGREKLYVPKIDGLWKHAGRKKAEKAIVMKGAKVKAGAFYFGGNTSHEKNERLLLKRSANPINRQVIAATSRERKRKLVQFTLLFTLLSLGRPMSDFEAMSSMFRQLKVPDCPSTHWSVTSGWGIAESIFQQLKVKTQKTCFEARFISASTDEVTCIDNTAWLSVHLYVLKDWERMPFLLCLKKLGDGSSAEAITDAIMDSFLGDCGNLMWLEVAEKLVSFGADGAPVFQGSKTGVITRLRSAHTPFVTGMHYCAHRTNLDNLPIVLKIENLCQSLYTYFAHSPKRQSEFQKLALELETAGHKIQRNVKTRWISLLGPMQSVLSEYRTLLAHMSLNSISSSTAKANAAILLDLETFLALPALLPLLKCIDDLIRMAQSREIMVQDFIGAMRLCQCDLHAYYVDMGTTFRSTCFAPFHDIARGQSFTVEHEWKPDLETHVEYLSFRIADHSYQTHWHDEILGEQSSVTRDALDHVVFQVKKQCKEAAQKLIQELDDWFPNVDLLNAFGIVHPQYWLREDAEEMFRFHMLQIEDHLCKSRTVIGGGLSGEESTDIRAPLDFKVLLEQQSYFKLTMVGNAAKIIAEQDDNPRVLNPMTRMWRRFGANALIRLKIFEWFKLAEIAIVIVMGSVEDERVFSNLVFIKSKLRNRLTEHLECMVRMFTQRFFTLSDFPFDDAISNWLDVERRGVVS